jgi:hypothetical protein
VGFSKLRSKDADAGSSAAVHASKFADHVLPLHTHWPDNKLSEIGSGISLIIKWTFASER